MLSALLSLYLLAIGFVWWCAEDERDLLGRPRRSRQSTAQPGSRPSLLRRALARACPAGAASLQARRAA